MYNKLAIIGDIHGNFDKLRLLFNNKQLSKRKLIFVGDYINRGYKSKEVLDFLIQLRDNNKLNIIFLRGNHEVSLMQYHSKANFYDFVLQGGIPTIISYVKAPIKGDVHKLFVDSFPSKHLNFIKKTKLFYENDELLVSHLGLSISEPNLYNEYNLVINHHPELFKEDLKFNKLLITGHYTQKNRKPFISDNFICIDTGSGQKNGKLTAFLFPERKYLQV